MQNAGGGATFYTFGSAELPERPKQEKACQKQDAAPAKDQSGRWVRNLLVLARKFLQLNIVDCMALRKMH